MFPSGTLDEMACLPLWSNQPLDTFPSEYIVLPIVPNFDEGTVTLAHLPNDEADIPRKVRTYTLPS